MRSLVIYIRIIISFSIYYLILIARGSTKPRIN
nr:MAG TPA: hypothetical protein [Caudoviricetes sp.]